MLCPDTEGSLFKESKTAIYLMTFKKQYFSFIFLYKFEVVNEKQTENST